MYDNNYITEEAPGHMIPYRILPQDRANSLSQGSEP